VRKANNYEPVPRQSLLVIYPGGLTAGDKPYHVGPVPPLEKKGDESPEVQERKPIPSILGLPENCTIGVMLVAVNAPGNHKLGNRLPIFDELRASDGKGEVLANSRICVNLVRIRSGHPHNIFGSGKSKGQPQHRPSALILQFGRHEQQRNNGEKILIEIEVPRHC
jgi:hypothetical protein